MQAKNIHETNNSQCDVTPSKFDSVESFLGQASGTDEERQAVFAEKLQELTTLAEKIESRSNAVNRYLADLPALVSDLARLTTIIDQNVDFHSQRWWFSTSSRNEVLIRCRTCLDGFADVLEVMSSLRQIPVDMSVFRLIAKIVDSLLPQSHGDPYEIEGTQQLIEEDLAIDGLALLRHEMRLLETYAQAADSVATGPGVDTKVLIGCLHSDDFRCVNWFGVEYTFSTAQANIIQRLWMRYEQRIRFVSQSELAEAAGGDGDSVRDIFKIKGSQLHAAWGSMIRKEGKDMYCLHVPDET